MTQDECSLLIRLSGCVRYLGLAASLSPSLKVSSSSLRSAIPVAVSGNWARSTPWTISLVHVSCLLTLVISWSNFLTCSSIVVWYLLSSSLVNVPVVVRVRFPRLFHWIPAILKFVGTFCVVRYMLIVFLISNISACSFFASTFLWMMIVRSDHFGGPDSFCGFTFFATVAQVFPPSVC